MKPEHKSAIKFLSKEGSSPKIIYERMVTVYGENSPSYYQIEFSCKPFKWDRESIHENSRYGRSVEARSEDIIKKVEDMVLTQI